ncbi:amino acid synthesis family protein [Roseovarius sp. Pro17]|uniref:amino acid synthesis family protein n=1 Tax=Roseovarius sp. Pro17 TaxID=3108175 RepID=UPI003A7F2D0F
MAHASALIHTLLFGDFYRDGVGAEIYLEFTNTRGPANTQIQIPLMDKNDTGRRSHYLTVQFSIPDAPAVDELVVALGAVVGGRPHHRIGDHYSDLTALGRDVENPAVV